MTVLAVSFYLPDYQSLLKEIDWLVLADCCRNPTQSERQLSPVSDTVCLIGSELIHFSPQWTCNGKKVAIINVKVEPDQLILKYDHKRQDGAWQPVEYDVNIEWTPCHYGGQRPWFICSMGGCGQRVAILYGNSIFACRKCHQLAYACQREVSHDRALRRAQNIRKKLGGSANMLEPFPPKPKGMRWCTYWRMADQHNAFHWTALVGMAEQFGIKIDI